jgi:tetratricopeptide (TPR) repeat protein
MNLFKGIKFYFNQNWKKTFQLGLQRLQGKDYKSAIQNFDEVLRMEPHYEAFHNRGVANYRLDNYNEAIRDYKEALAINPRSVESFLGLGAAYTRMNKMDSAIETYSMALEINPKSVLAYTNRGFIRMQVLDYKGALQDFDDAIQLNQRNAIAFQNRGSVHYLLGNQAQAYQDWEKAKLLGIQPGMEAFYHLMSR